MRKSILFVFMILLILPVIVNAEELSSDTVTLSNCVDGNSARFMLGVNEIKVKFLGVEAAENIVDETTEKLSDDLVNEYVCNALKKAKTIKIEYEPNIEKEDKFGRIEAWVFLDGQLLQEDLVKNGYAKIMYVYDDFTYLDKLQEAQDFAKENNLGLWKNEVKKETDNNKSNTEETKTQKKKKSKGIFAIILDFFGDLFNKLFKLIDDIIKNIF